MPFQSLTRKQRITRTLLISLGLTFISIFLGLDHVLKMIGGFALYALATWFLLSRLTERKEKWFAAIVLAIPVLVFIPLHFLLEDALYSLPSTLFLLLGLGFGALIVGKKLRFLIPSVLVVAGLSFSFVFYGFPLWTHWASFGTVTGNVNDQVEPFTFSTPEGTTVTADQFKGKTLVFDFWYVGCGECYRKFPDLEALFQQYKDDLNVELFAVHIPQKAGQNEQAQGVLNEKGYNFPLLLADSSREAANFKVELYPTVIVLQEGTKVVYRGRISGVKNILAG